MNKKANENGIWHIIGWIIAILVVVLVIAFILSKFEIINLIKELFPSFGE